MNKLQVKNLDNKVVYNFLEDLVNNDENINSNVDETNDDIIDTSINYALIVTKLTGDTDDNAKITHISSLYDSAENYVPDYVFSVYGKEMKQLGIKSTVAYYQ